MYKFGRTAGELITNVPWKVIQHSPNGFEIGYNGSGPADLALNILENALTIMGHKGERTPCFMGTSCFALAWRLHQQFKQEFIVGMPKKGGQITVGRVTAWIEENRKTLEPRWRNDGILEDV